MDDKTQRGRPTAPPLLSKWDYWRVSWLTLACTIIKLVTFARRLPQWDTWWKMAVLEKRTNDREAHLHEAQSRLDERLDERLRRGLRQRLDLERSRGAVDEAQEFSETEV